MTHDNTENKTKESYPWSSQASRSSSSFCRSVCFRSLLARRRLAGWLAPPPLASLPSPAAAAASSSAAARHVLLAAHRPRPRDVSLPPLPISLPALVLLLCDHHPHLPRPSPCALLFLPSLPLTHSVARSVEYIHPQLVDYLISWGSSLALPAHWSACLPSVCVSSGGRGGRR